MGQLPVLCEMEVSGNVGSQFWSFLDMNSPITLQLQCDMAIEFSLHK